MDFKALFDSIRDCVLLTDNGGYVTQANPATTQILSYEPQALKGRHISIIYEADDDKIKSSYELDEARKHGKLELEGFRIRSGGERIWAEISIFAANGVDAGFVVILRDRMERKKLEMNLRQSEESFRLMVEGVKDYAIFMLDTKGCIQSWNEGAQNIKGYTFNEIRGRHFSVFYTAEDLNDGKPERELRIAVQTGKYEEEGWRVRKNGSVFWASVVISAMFNEFNQHIGFSKVTRDLTERREKEEMLRQSEERYRSLVEQVTDYGIFMLDPKGKIISWNEGARRIQGYNENEIRGKYFSIFYPEEDVLNNKPARELRSAIQTGKYEEEGWRIKKDGSRFWASVVITAVYNSNHVLIGFSKVTRDLSERKASERALRDSYDRLRNLTAELRKTNHELSFANKELEQFTSIVSHDLQEPVRTIKSFLQHIRNKIGAGDYTVLDEYISKCLKSADHMRELIRSLLSYAQLSREADPQASVDITEVMADVMQNLRNAIDRSGAQVELHCDQVCVQGDKTQISQLIQNLLSNAFKFSENVPQVEIRCKKLGDSMEFAVSDRGIGIAEEDRERIFEIFRRLHSQKQYSGTGIGLAICKRIVDNHGGKLWLESQPGKGTTFYFTLKRAQCAKEKQS